MRRLGQVQALQRLGARDQEGIQGLRIGQLAGAAQPVRGQDLREIPRESLVDPIELTGPVFTASGLTEGIPGAEGLSAQLEREIFSAANEVILRRRVVGYLQSSGLDRPAAREVLSRVLRRYRTVQEKSMQKALFIGPRGGKWADPEHTIPYDSEKHGLVHKKVSIRDKTSSDPETEAVVTLPKWIQPTTERMIAEAADLTVDERNQLAASVSRWLTMPRASGTPMWKDPQVRRAILEARQWQDHRDAAPDRQRELVDQVPGDPQPIYQGMKLRRGMKIRGIYRVGNDHQAPFVGVVRAVTSDQSGFRYGTDYAQAEVILRDPREFTEKLGVDGDPQKNPRETIFIMTSRQGEIEDSTVSRPPPAESFTEKLDRVQAHLNQQLQQIRDTMRAGAEYRNPRTGIHATVVRNSRPEPGKTYRLVRYNEDGLIGHTFVDSLEEAVREVWEEIGEPVESAPGSLDKMAAGWARESESEPEPGWERMPESEPESESPVKPKIGREDFEEREEARQEKFERRAARAAAESARARAAHRGITERIPLGQPIMVGHHSEKRHRRDLDRAHRAMRREYEEGQKAAYYRQRAATERRGISSDDPTALEKLRKKVERLETQRKKMKAANKVWRRVIKKYPISDDLPADQAEVVAKQRREALTEGLEKEGFGAQEIERVLAAHTNTFKFSPGSNRDSPPFPGYEVSNLGAKIRTAKKRARELEAEGMARTQQDAEGGPDALRSHTSVRDEEFTVEENIAANRVQIRFDGKPTPETRTTLKAAGFRWAPSEGAWQRQLSNAARARVGSVVRALTPQEPAPPPEPTPQSRPEPEPEARPVDPDLWEIRQDPGGGPSKIRLTEEGERVTARVGGDVSLEESEALQALNVDHPVAMEEEVVTTRGPTVRPTPAGRQWFTEIPRLSNLGYVELVPDAEGRTQRYQITDKGRFALDAIERQRDYLKNRIRARLPGDSGDSRAGSPEREQPVQGELFRSAALKILSPDDLRKAQGAVYVGPRGGRWADPEHKIPLRELQRQPGAQQRAKRRLTAPEQFREARAETKAAARGVRAALKTGTAKDIQTALRGLVSAQEAQVKALRAGDQDRRADRVEKRAEGVRNALWAIRGEAFGSGRELDLAKRRRLRKQLAGLLKSQLAAIDSGRRFMLKAEPRGGKYHRRIPRPGGGYRYIYDPEKYHQREDAHLDGEGASRAYIGRRAADVVAKAGKKGCGPDAMKGLVRKHGSKRVAQVLRDQVENGSLTFKKGKFYPARKRKGDGQ